MTEKRKANFKEMKNEMKENRKLLSQGNSNTIHNNLPLINASIKLKKIIRNPKVVNNMSLMSEISEDKSFDEQSEHKKDQNDIDKIEL